MERLLTQHLLWQATAPDIVVPNKRTSEYVFDELGHQVVRGKVITDLSVAYNFTPKTSLSLGVNNLFDLYPEKNVKTNNNNEQFIYSRATSQFGLNGRYVFLRASFHVF